MELHLPSIEAWGYLTPAPSMDTHRTDLVIPTKVSDASPVGGAS